jgi:putative addiction module component (TIGR02574 family)
MEVSMHDQVIELAQRGKALTTDERSRLVDILLASLHEPLIAEVEAAWEVEIERRLAEYDRGEVTAIDAEEVFGKARSMAR